MLTSLLNSAIPDNGANMDPSFQGDVYGAAVLIIVVMAIFFAVFGLIYFIAYIGICRKLDIPVITIFIPIYNNYVFFKAFGMKKWFWIMTIASLISNLLMYIDPTSGIMETYGPVIFLLMAAIVILSVVCSFIYTYRMALSFGKGIFFFLGLLFLPGIFYLVLAFGKSDYVGPPN